MTRFSRIDPRITSCLDRVSRFFPRNIPAERFLPQNTELAQYNGSSVVDICFVFTYFVLHRRIFATYEKPWMIPLWIATQFVHILEIIYISYIDKMFIFWYPVFSGFYEYLHRITPSLRPEKRWAFDRSHP